MEKTITITEVSKALGIPASTLRYWDKQGVLRFERNNENNYRQFSFQTMVDICDIIFYRELEVPLYTIKKREEMTAENLLNLFSETKDHLERSIDHLQKVVDRITARENILKQLDSLKYQKPRIRKQKLDPIHYFDFTDKKLIQLYLEDPTLSADIVNFDEKNEYVCGLFANIDSSCLLREGDKEEKNYLYGIVWRNQSEDTNLQDLLKEAGIKKEKIGDQIFQYLVSARDQDDYRDYFKMWIELTE
ncbi:helix-turn-helix domain-containing protein [Planococcus sp. CAU13]|uniref:helix-turn-helix domain-containing protein n=1 Tax=Planococcus sp. CAU13 TaxID=1541197 RepID=UPI00068E6CA8|nr:MerR family transcriptional regulator [Planococcus sp. CAU13]